MSRLEVSLQPDPLRISSNLVLFPTGWEDVGLELDLLDIISPPKKNKFDKDVINPSKLKFKT